MSTTRNKVLLGFGAILLLAMLLCGAGIYSLNKTAENAGRMNTESVLPLGDAGEAADAFQRVRVNVYAMIADAGNGSAIDAFAKSIDEFSGTVDKKLADFEQYTASSDKDEKQALETMKTGWAKYKGKIPQVEQLARAGKRAEALSFTINELKPIALSLSDATNTLVTSNETQARDLSTLTLKTADSAIKLMFLLLFVGLVAGIIGGLVIVRGVTAGIEGLTNEAQHLVAAAMAGQLQTRGDPTKIPAEFRPIIVGINNCLDTLIAPLNKAAVYIDRISKGDIPPKITDSYQGDSNTIKQSLNECIDAVQRLVDDAAMLSTAAVNGQFATRADVSKHQGDFRKIVVGVNATLDTVVEKMFWYESLLDALPFPISVTDSRTVRRHLRRCQKGRQRNPEAGSAYYCHLPEDRQRRPDGTAGNQACREAVGTG